MDLSDAVSTFVGALALPLATLLPLINPPGTAPVFLSMTAGAADAGRARLARHIAGHALTLLVATMLSGSYVLTLFGLSIATIKIAGGVLVFATAWHLLRSDQSPDSQLAAAAPALAAAEMTTRSFYPLTFPITIGPGSLSVAIALGASIRTREVAAVPKLAGAVVGIVIVSATIYLCYRGAARVSRALGDTGSAVLTRLSAFILLSVGVQMLCDGVAERFGLAPPR